MTSAGYLRFPHLHGDLLTFVAEDDVWLAPAAGGRSWRVSADRAQVRSPRLARDGASVAWTSWRDGPPEVYLAGVDGGTSRRLTYWGDPDTRVCGWTPDGAVLAVTCAGQAFDRLTWAHELPPEGGAPRSQPYGPLADIAVEAAAVALLNGTWGRDPAAWKRYRGGTAGRLWTRRAGSSSPAPFRRILADLRGQFASPMLVAGRLAFLSDHEGTGNLYSCQLDGSDLRRHTDHDGFYARQAGSDGRRVVYQVRGEIWIVDDLSPGSEPRRVDITLGSASAAVTPRLVSANDHLGALSCDDTGRASAIEVRGTVHWLTHRDGPARALAVPAGACARLPRVLGTTGQVVWVTDAGGVDALEVGSAAGPELTGAAPPPPPRRLGAGSLGIISEVSAAPDGSTVAVAARDGRLFLVTIESGQVTLLAESPDGPMTGLIYAPDSAWLAWSQPGPRPLSRIRLARLADATIVDVTEGRFTDSEPAFSLDGNYLAFLSARSFDPVYDAHFFDLSFPYGSRPYLVPLAAGTQSPFDPLTEGRAVGGRDKDEPDQKHRASKDGAQKDGAPRGDGARSDEPKGDDPDQAPGDPDRADPGRPASAQEADSPDSTPPVVVTVHTEGLAERVVSVPVAVSRYSSLKAVTGGLAWLKEPLAGVLGESAADPDDSRAQPVLERFDLTKRTCAELVSELDWFEVSGDGNRVVVRDGDELRVVPSERADDDSDGPGEAVTVDLSRARFMADPAALWRHAYDEAARYMQHDFWVADLADVDWAAVLDAYRPVLSRIGGSRDFADLLLEVFGELGSSHAYVRPAHDPDENDGGRVGLLGADLAPGADGSWRVARVLPGESSDPLARSPLAAPGVNVQAGAAILAVDGRPVDPLTGPGPLLVGAAGKPVELTVASDGGRSRRVAVTPLTSDRRLRYQDWVAGRRRLVRELSDGRAGYLHVPDMLGEGWAHFHRDLRVEMGREALVVDVRANRGGHVSELVVEKLARRIMGWDLPRGLSPATYPQDAPRGPVVALTDEFAGSDGDMVTAAIRILGIGPVVGTRTWGGVIGIDSPFMLVDGTQMTVPRYAIWLDGYGWSVENHGVDPDVEVVTSPDDWARGADTQLETAVQMAMEALAARPPAGPPDTGSRPSRRRPPLPPRPATGAEPPGGDPAQPAGRDPAQAPGQAPADQPPELATGVAHSARVRDYWLGGTANFPADREAGEQAIAAYPDIARSVRATRAFLARSVRYLAGDAGIRQFLDLGTGIPAANNTHEVAQSVTPQARIVYVDNDPIVLGHARSLLTSDPRGATAYIDADLRNLDTILAEARHVLDFGQPVAIMLVAVLQFIPPQDDPYGIVTRLLAAIPAGSYLVVAHPANDIEAAAMADMAGRLSRLMAQQVVPRSRADVTRFFAGLDLVAPGVVRLPEWRPAAPADAAGPSTMWGGIGRKR